MAKKIIATYIFLSVLSHLGVALGAAMYVMYLLTEGLNLFTANLPNLVYFLTVAIMEIPTGSIADVFGRKKSFVLSCLLHSAGLFIYAYSDNFWSFALAEFTIAVGTTCSSGAFQAWLVDELAYHEYDTSVKKRLEKIFSAEHFAGNVAGALGAVIGGILAEKNMTWPWIAGGCIALFSAILAMILLKEHSFIKEGTFKQQVAQTIPTIRTAIQYTRENSVVWFILALGAAQTLALQAPNMQWQPLFSERFSLPIAALGFIFSGIRAALMIGALAAPYLARWTGREQRLFLLLQSITALGIIGSVLSTSLPMALGVFMLHEMARGAFDPALSAWLNRHIPSKQRATILSLVSTVKFLGGALGLIASGLMAQYVSTQAAWVVSGGFLITATTILYIKKGGRK